MNRVVLASLALCACQACGEPAPAPIVADPCTDAWRELVAVRDGLSSVVEGVQSPSEADFRAACALLPAEARPCLAPSWHLAHEVECSDAVKSVPKDVRKRVDARLGGRSP